MDDYVIVMTATETREQAVTLAGGIVRERLAAGVQIVGPVTSIFWHDGEYGEGTEWQASFRTTEDRYDELEAYILEHHPWQNPEVVAVPIVAGSRQCLEWLSRSVGPVDA